LDPVKSLANNKKIQNYTNYKAKTSLINGLGKTYDWLKNNIQFC